MARGNRSNGNNNNNNNNNNSSNNNNNGSSNRKPRRNDIWSDKSYLWCETHGYNPNHVTADCKSNGSKPTCNFCKKTGHTENDCRTNPASTKYQGMDTTMTGVSNPWASISYQSNKSDKFGRTDQVDIDAIAAEKNYCKYCNNKGHTASYCNNQDAKLASIESKLVCRICKSHGHTHLQCEHPAYKKCGKCGRNGHLPKDCPRELVTSANAEFKRKLEEAPDCGKGSTWKLPSNMPMAKPLAMQWVLNEYKLVMQRTGQPISEDFVRATEDDIRQAQKDFPKPHCAPVCTPDDLMRNFPGLDRLSNVAPNVAMGNPNMAPVQPWVPSVSSCLSLQHPARPNEQYQPSQSDMRTITDKLTASRRIHFEKYNNRFQQLSKHIREQDLLTSDRLLQLQLAMSAGKCWIYRDPNAMGSVLNQSKPVCTSCHQAGHIVDRHMVPVNSAITLQDWERLEDNVNTGHRECVFGLFVAFECCCCNDYSYTYEPRTEEEIRADQEKLWKIGRPFRVGAWGRSDQYLQ